MHLQTTQSSRYAGIIAAMHQRHKAAMRYISLGCLSPECLWVKQMQGIDILKDSEQGLMKCFLVSQLLKIICCQGFTPKLWKHIYDPAKNTCQSPGLCWQGSNIGMSSHSRHARLPSSWRRHFTHQIAWQRSTSPSRFAKLAFLHTTLVAVLHMVY